MASTTQDTLWKTFLAIAGNGGELAGLFGDLVTQGNATTKTAVAPPQKRAVRWNRSCRPYLNLASAWSHWWVDSWAFLVEATIHRQHRW